jgi:hypothetical protein
MGRRRLGMRVKRKRVEFRSSGVQEFRSSGVQEFRSSGVQEFRSSGVDLGRIRNFKETFIRNRFV